MKKLYYNNGKIYWSRSDDSSYIECEINEDGTCQFIVFFVPQYGGSAILDSYCNNFQDAVSQLEMVSI